MNFVNNYAEQVELAQGATLLALNLPNGLYRLTLSDARGAEATRHEHIEALVEFGTAWIGRGLEGSADQAWPAGSWIYCSITAGVMTGLQGQIAALNSRLEQLEIAGLPANTLRVTIAEFAPLERRGYDGYGEAFVNNPLGAVLPASLFVGGGSLALVQALVGLVDGGGYYLSLRFSGDARPVINSLASVVVEGIGTLEAADAYVAVDDDIAPNDTYYEWLVPGEDWPVGAMRLITFNPA